MTEEAKKHLEEIKINCVMAQGHYYFGNISDDDVDFLIKNLETEAAEVKQLQNEMVLKDAENAAMGSQMLDLQQDCIRERRRAEAAEACNEQFQIKWDILAKRQNTLQDELEAAGARWTELLAVCKKLRDILRDTHAACDRQLMRVGQSKEIRELIFRADEAIRRAEEK